MKKQIFDLLNMTEACWYFAITEDMFFKFILDYKIPFILTYDGIRINKKSIYDFFERKRIAMNY